VEHFLIRNINKSKLVCIDALQKSIGTRSRKELSCPWSVTALLAMFMKVNPIASDIARWVGITEYWKNEINIQLKLVKIYGNCLTIAKLITMERVMYMTNCANRNKIRLTISGEIPLQTEHDTSSLFHVIPLIKCCNLFELLKPRINIDVDWEDPLLGCFIIFHTLANSLKF